MSVSAARWMQVPLTLQGSREQLLEDLQPHTPLHLFLALIPDQPGSWIAIARALFDAEGQPKSQACPVLHLNRTDKTTIGLLTTAGFLQGTACCTHCVHQLECAVDGKTRSFKALVGQKTQE